MPAYFNEGFCVRTPSWHRQENLLDEFIVLPQDRERGILLAGHDFRIVEVPVGSIGNAVSSEAVLSEHDVVRVDGKWFAFKPEPSKKSLYIVQPREGGTFGPVHGNFVGMANDGYAVIENGVGWDFAEAMCGLGAKVDTGLTLKDGARCVICLYLDEPVTIPGDDSLILPYGVVTWSHDGSGALSGRSTSVRVVCGNTDDMAAAEARRLGTDFTIRHTKHWKDRVEDAKLAIRGVRDNFAEYTELARELATMPVTPAQRELFVTTFLPMPPEALISDRVRNNVEDARTSVRTLFEGRTIPEAHKLTAYGLRLAGVEYLDHLRGYRNSDTYVGRQLLRTEPAKVKLASLIKDVVAAV